MASIPSFIFGAGTKYKTQEELERAREAVKAMLGDIGQSQYEGWGGVLADLGKGIGARIEKGRISEGQEGLEAAQAPYSQTLAEIAAGQGGGGYGGGSYGGGAGEDTLTGDGSLDSYFASIRGAESGGNDNAKNPLSSASGRYQFTRGTWDNMIRTHPELGLTRDGMFDPSQQERAIRAFTADNARVLSGAGIPISGGTLYGAHFLGAGGAKQAFRSPDNARMSDVVGPGVIRANPFLANMTVGDFKRWTAGKGGGASIDLSRSGGDDALAGGGGNDVAAGGAGTDPLVTGSTSGGPSLLQARPVPVNDAGLRTPAGQEFLGRMTNRAQMSGGLQSSPMISGMNGPMPMRGVTTTPLPMPPGTVAGQAPPAQFAQTPAQAPIPTPSPRQPTPPVLPAQAPIPVARPAPVPPPTSAPGPSQPPPGRLSDEYVQPGAAAPAPAPTPPRAPTPTTKVDPFTDMILGDQASKFRPGNFRQPLPPGVAEGGLQAARQALRGPSGDTLTGGAGSDTLAGGAGTQFPAAPPAPGTPAAAGFGVPRAGGGGGAFPPAPAAPGQQQAGGGNKIAKLMFIISSPYASDEQKRMATAMLQREYSLEDERRKAASPEAMLDMQLKQAEIAKAQAEAGGVGKLDSDAIASLQKTVLGLDSFGELSKTSRAYRGMLKTVDEAAKAPGGGSKVSDLNLIFALGKIFDPASVVRSGEVDEIKAQQAWPDWLYGAYKGLEGKAGLGPDVRQAILDEAFTRVQAAEDQYTQETQFFRDFASRKGVLPEDVIPNMGKHERWKSGAASASVKKKTDEFLGGGETDG